MIFICVAPNFIYIYSPRWIVPLFQNCPFFFFLRILHPNKKQSSGAFWLCVCMWFVCVSVFCLSLCCLWLYIFLCNCLYFVWGFVLSVFEYFLSVMLCFLWLFVWLCPFTLHLFFCLSRCVVCFLGLFTGTTAWDLCTANLLCASSRRNASPWHAHHSSQSAAGPPGPLGPDQHHHSYRRAHTAGPADHPAPPTCNCLAHRSGASSPRHVMFWFLAQILPEHQLSLNCKSTPSSYTFRKQYGNNSDLMKNIFLSAQQIIFNFIFFRRFCLTYQRAWWSYHYCSTHLIFSDLHQGVDLGFRVRLSLSACISHSKIVSSVSKLSPVCLHLGSQ